MRKRRAPSQSSARRCGWKLLLPLCLLVVSCGGTPEVGVDAGLADVSRGDTGAEDGGSRDADSGIADLGPIDLGTDAGTSDSGFEDSGPRDLGFADTGPTDAEPGDLGSPDTGPTDASPVDASPSDASPVDASPVDASPSDASPSDASPSDASPADASPADASPADASPADASPADASPADASPADASPADASPVDVGIADSGAVDGGPPDAGFYRITAVGEWNWLEANDYATGRTLNYTTCSAGACCEVAVPVGWGFYGAAGNNSICVNYMGAVTSPSTGSGISCQGPSPSYPTDPTTCVGPPTSDAVVVSSRVEFSSPNPCNPSFVPTACTVDMCGFVGATFLSCPSCPTGQHCSSNFCVTCP